MATASATIQLPESFFPVMKTKNANKFVRETLAVDMYREGKVSPGKAKELAGARNKWEMLLILDRKGIPINYSAEERLSNNSIFGFFQKLNQYAEMP